MIAYYQSNDIK